MKYMYTRTAGEVLDTLKAYRDDLHEHNLRKQHWPLLDRLISREMEMMPVWKNIAQQRLSWQQCHTLLEQIFFAGAYGTKERNTRLKADYSRLTDLSEKIAAQAAALSALLTEQDQILNRNAFSLERTTHIVDLIEAASEQNGHYRSYLHEPLDALRCQYDGKYWPSLEQILNVAALEIPEAAFLHRSEEAIVDGRGEAVPDYLRKLFDHIETARNSHWGLPSGLPSQTPAWQSWPRYHLIPITSVMTELKCCATGCIKKGFRAHGRRGAEYPRRGQPPGERTANAT